MRKGYYIVLTHSYTPMQNDPSKMNCTEKCEFVDDIKNRHLKNATAILDFGRREMVKNRVRESTFDQYLQHVEKTHPNEYGEFKDYMLELGIIKQKKTLGDKEVKVAGENIEVAE